MSEVEQLKQKINALEKKLKKCYGLVWEDKPEQFDELSKNALPILVEKNHSQYPDLNWHLKRKIKI